MQHTSARIVALLFVALLQVDAPAEEAFNRGLIAVVNDQGQIYLGWRLLEDDPPDVAFNVYRRTDGGSPVRVNAKPLVTSTNLVDAAAQKDKANVWFVRALSQGRELAPSETASLAPNTPPNRVRSIKLQGDYRIQPRRRLRSRRRRRVRLRHQAAGRGHGLDPGTTRPSPDTFKLEAYNGRRGDFMWRYDLGWNMNMGVWWTPFITGDFDGDGKAEVALKMAPYAATKEEAVIAEGGFVLEGPEYLVVLNGMTGKEIARADWVERGDPTRWGDTARKPREPQSDWRRKTRRQDAQSILVARGTYTLMYVDAWNLVGGKLVRSWRWFGDETTPPVRGQGAHGMHVYDFDGDGREESRSGFGDGRRQRQDVVDERPRASGRVLHRRHHSRSGRDSRSPTATRTGRRSTASRSRMRSTGEMIWGHPHPTLHIHDWGMFADIDAANPGYELYARRAEAGARPVSVLSARRETTVDR